MNLGAIAHMPDNRYCYCLRPKHFLIRLQTGRDDLQEVIIHYQDKYIPLRFFDTRKKSKMKLVAQDHSHDYFEIELEIDVVCLRYYFELIDQKGERIYYSNCRFLSKAPNDIDRMYDLPQNLREIERFEVPAWAANKVIYQVFPARFATSQSIDAKTWYTTPIKAATDLKGDLKGLISKLDYINE